jgi:putative spermidine/putrescine transport system permease protein
VRTRAIAVAGLLAPALALTGLAFVLPLLWLGRMSLDSALSGGILQGTLGVGNYLQFFTDPYYLGVLWRSLWIGLLVTLATLLVSYPIALFLFRTRSRWRGLLIVLTIAPLLVSSVVRTFGWMVILSDAGWVNGVLRLLHFTGQPLRLMNNEVGVVIGLTEIMMPTMILALISGFARLDPTLEEAARSLGAPPWRTFMRVTLPLSLPGIVTGCLITFILSISSFVTPRLLGGGRVQMMATNIYEEALETLNWPLAATESIILIIVMVLAMTAYERLGRTSAA